MDMVLSQGVKYSCNLVPKISRLPTALLRHPRVFSSYQHTQFPGNHRITSYQFTNYSLLNKQYGNLLESSICYTKLNQYSTSSKTASSAQHSESSKGCNEPQKVTTFQKMKQLAKDYWHILIPVHIITSAGWVAIFYAAAKNGVDVVGILESLHLSEKYLDMIRNSSAGHWAVTYALYKLFTPIRYTITVGGTTMCIRYLNRMGYLKFKDTARDTAKIMESAKQKMADTRASFGKSKEPKS